MIEMLRGGQMDVGAWADINALPGGTLAEDSGGRE
jgi:hypothetical protein